MSTRFYERWRRSFRKRLARVTWPHDFKIVRHQGALFLLNYRHFVDRQIAFAGGHEREQLAFLLARINAKPCDCFIDVGANFGLYSIIIAREHGPRVVAFEPDPRNYRQLQCNLYLNDLADSVTLHRLAASDRPGRLPFLFAADSHTGESRVAAAHPEATVVEAVRLDDTLAFAGKRLAVKIDVEQHELEVFAGMTRLLRENRCLLQVECFPANIAALSAAMAAAGYRHLHRIDHDHYFGNE